MAELERMVGQKVQSLHERVTAKEDTFRVRAPSHDPETDCTSVAAWQSCPSVVLRRLPASPALLDNTFLRLCAVPFCLQRCSQAAQQRRAH